MRYRRLALILGNCLFGNHRLLLPDEETLFFMAEDYGLCTRFNYHKHKLVLILSAMRSHRDHLRKYHPIEYLELKPEYKDTRFEDNLFKAVEKFRIEEIVTYDIENHFFRQRIEQFCSEKGLKLAVKDSPGFLTTHTQFKQYRNSFSRILMNDFYIWQRKRLKLLLTENGRPLNGKWSFDSENRKKIPEGMAIPTLPKLKRTKHTTNVCNLVEVMFAGCQGSTDNFFLPTTREQALHWLECFLRDRFANFGPYEDAMSEAEDFLFHSLLSPLINIGLLTPGEVVDRALEYKVGNEIPFSSLEGFIRQVTGWREFIRGVYNTEELKGNFFRHERKLTEKWYRGTTGLPPLDDVIRRVIKNGFAHHIERLMVLSNSMLLCEIHPDEVYRWFMELFVDSSDWVMEPNVYGMGQFADGGVFSTKPYVSGSRYILKMSDFEAGAWCDIWDGLYWRFIDKHRDYFSMNQRMGIIVRMLDKLDVFRRKRIFKLAERFIGEVTR